MQWQLSMTGSLARKVGRDHASLRGLCPSFTAFGVQAPAQLYLLLHTIVFLAPTMNDYGNLARRPSVPDICKKTILNRVSRVVMIRRRRRCRPRSRLELYLPPFLGDILERNMT